MNPIDIRTSSPVDVQPLTNKVLRNAYLLLAMMLLLSAAVTTWTIAAKIPPLNIWIALALLIGTPFIAMRMARTAMGIPAALGYGAVLGFIFGPIVGIYFAAGPQIVLNAFVGTAVITLGLSMYALMTRKDFSFLGGFMFVGALVILLAVVANIFLQIPMMSLVISSVVVLLSACGILYFTSAAINGGETNYVVIAIGLFADIWSMFMSLLRIFGVLGGDD